MDGARKLKEHIAKLQAILDLPPVDPQLASALRGAITSLIQYQYNATKQGVASQKIRMNQTKTTVYRQLYSWLCRIKESLGNIRLCRISDMKLAKVALLVI